jgi:hypothetical protein
VTIAPPKVGQIVSLPFIWRREKQARSSITEGYKDRPCVVVAASSHGVFVIPISHSKPMPDDTPYVIEI